MFTTDIQKQLQADALDCICHHLQRHSQEISNISMMTVMGFCRNCLAKWLVLEARKISKNFSKNSNQAFLVSLLDAFGYEDAAQVVYGCAYAEWKARYQVEATNEQMYVFLLICLFVCFFYLYINLVQMKIYLTTDIL
jgi:hypothetical protein